MGLFRLPVFARQQLQATTLLTATLTLTTLASMSVMGCTSENSAPPAAPEQATSKPAARGETPKDRDYVDADGVVRRGEPVSKGTPLTVESVMKQASTLDGKLVKVTGTVGKVCSKSGCWFELKGDKAKAGIRITSKGYRFFVPSKAQGMTATLEGDLKVQMLDIETAQHYADDAAHRTGRAAQKITEAVPEVSIAAVAVEMRQQNQDG